MTQPETAEHFNPSLRHLSREEFVARFGGVYEHSPWIAAELHRRGLTEAEDRPDGLASALAGIVAEADRDAKLSLIRAHPDLAGRTAVAGDLTRSSQAEQAGAGLDRCTPEEYREFQDLNDRYKARFGFPFILAVAGKTRREILEAFRARVRNDPDTEFRTALEQIDRIALLRLRGMVQ